MLPVAYALLKARVERWLDSQNSGAAIKQVVMLTAMSTIDGWLGNGICTNRFCKFIIIFDSNKTLQRKLIHSTGYCSSELASEYPSGIPTDDSAH